MFGRRRPPGIPAGITAHAQPIIPAWLDAMPGLMLWLRAADAVYDGSNIVQSIADRSGRGNNVLLDTGGPVYSATGFGTNSVPYILHDGTDDSLKIADSADFEFGTGTFAVFVSCRFVSQDGSYRAVIAKGSDSAGSGWRCFRSSGNALHLYRDGASNYTASTLTFLAGTDSVLQWGIDALAGVSMYAKLSTHERAAVTVGAITDTANLVRIGRDNTGTGNYAANMRWSEMFVFKRSAATGFSDAESTTVITNMRAYAGL